MTPTALARPLLLLAAALLLLSLGCGSRSGGSGGAGVLSDGDDGEAIVAKSVKASGGLDAYDRWKCGFVKYVMLRGTPGEEGEFTVEDTFQLPEHFKRVETRTGEKLPFTVAFTVERGKKKFKRGDGKPESDADWLPARTHELADFCSPAGLLGSGMKATATGKKKLDGEEVLGVRIGPGKFGYADLYFARKTGLLVRSVTMSRQDMEKKHPPLEATTSVHDEVQGMMVPKHIVVTQGGQMLRDVRILELRFEEKFDKGAFALP
jgi:hypothetical protein